VKYSKRKRIVNKDLIKSYRDKPCAICFVYFQTSPHHIKTRGAGGDDTEENLICLCGEHHIGINVKEFYEKYRNQIPEINRAAFERIVSRHGKKEDN